MEENILHSIDKTVINNNESFIKEMNIDTQFKRKPKILSVGQKQKFLRSKWKYLNGENTNEREHLIVMNSKTFKSELYPVGSFK